MKSNLSERAGADRRATARKHLYLQILGQCNLRCRMCYVPKPNLSLDYHRIKEFISRYATYQDLQSVTLCGGEVFIYPQLIPLVNWLSHKQIFSIIITNGTIDLLDKFAQPNLINLIVSLDGLPEFHDFNRGQGRFARSINFLKKALKLGFACEVFSVIVQENFTKIDEFEAYLSQQLGQVLPITYHPRKPPSYLNNHPTDNLCGQTQGLSFLTTTQYQKLASSKSIFPPKNFGCYQISITPNGQVYGCCEGTRVLGSWDEPVEELLNKFERALDQANLIQRYPDRCIEPEFACGLKDYGVTL